MEQFFCEISDLSITTHSTIAINALIQSLVAVKTFDLDLEVGSVVFDATKKYKRPFLRLDLPQVPVLATRNFTCINKTFMHL